MTTSSWASRTACSSVSVDGASTHANLIHKVTGNQLVRNAQKSEGFDRERERRVGCECGERGGFEWPSIPVELDPLVPSVA